jgi:trans-aconitate methyltransferase
MIALRERSDLALAAYFAGLQEPETRIDIVRHVWLDQMADTERLLDALEAVGAGAEEARIDH